MHWQARWYHGGFQLKDHEANCGSPILYMGGAFSDPSLRMLEFAKCGSQLPTTGMGRHRTLP
eukprot:6416656-Karenia_brevis.AAC.1